MPVSAETADKVIEMLKRATVANGETPARKGCLIELTADNCEELMITADLHGQRLTFNRLVEIADLANHPRRHLIMQEVCHGGPAYPNGAGCMSHLMLEDVAALKVEFPDRFHFLLSNHELAEMTDFPIVKSKKMLNLQFRCGIQEMYGEGADRVRRAYQDFIGSCPLAVRFAKSVFICHSTPEGVDEKGYDAAIFARPLTPADMVNHGPVFQLVWGRDFREQNAEAFARLVQADVLIHGHEPCLKGFHAPNGTQIIIDCCSQPACYVILKSTDRQTQASIVERIEFVK